MGIYYCACDKDAKEYFESPKDFSIKHPGIFHPTNPFANMFLMMNAHSPDFEIINDSGWYGPYGDHSEEYKNITEEVYAKYLEYYPWAKDEIYDPKDEK